MKKSLLLMTGFSVVAMTAGAQQLKSGYVTWPESSSLPTYINAWNAGNPITINGAAWEDENFFISRVKPKVRFRNANTQVYDIVAEDDKRLVFWVPVGYSDLNGVHTNALPNALFDSEAFSTWSYIDHYGDWTSPYGWTPGALADVAHKNGVAVSGVASVPWGSISSTWYSTLTSMGNISSETVAKFLYYHGCDGLGYNSEFSTSSTLVTNLRNLHKGIYTWMADKNPIFENMWYAGTNDNGIINFDSGISSFTGLFEGASMFLNYNWNSASLINSSINTANSVGKSPLYVYAGMNMQGGEPKSGQNYDLLAQYRQSIGLWGAHSYNMFWLDRSANGSNPSTMQQTYLNTCEQWFGNGPRNPAIKKEITTVRNHRPSDDFAGMSSMMTARSVLNWDLSEEPFITYFNLGNGKFFNWMGERVSDNEWYNIGIQDYLPTWRYWFAPTFLQKDVTEGSTGLSAGFTWDDAWFGGSCLRVQGSATKEYLHLFKTEFALVRTDVMTIRYKVLSGEADIRVAMSRKGTESTQQYPNTPAALNILTVSESAAAVEQGYKDGADGWITKTISFRTGLTNLTNSNFPVSVIALQFANAKDLDILIGEISICRPGVGETTPAAPEIVSSKVLSNNYKGVDGKIIFNMANNKASQEPCYNSEVNTSMFRLWARQKGGEPVFMGATTSWAGLIFSAPTSSDMEQKIQFGVSAVSIDNNSESEISWGEELDCSSYDIVDDIEINKTIIKPNESFEIKFVDPRHEAASWTIKDSDGNPVYTSSGVSINVADGLSTVGAYDLTVAWGDVTNEYTRYMSVSSESVGALPEIYTLSVDGEDVTESTNGISITVGDMKTLGYTGRSSDGSASRGINLNENWFGVPISELGLEGNQSFSVAAWVKYNELPSGLSNFVTIENRSGGWPYNNWGYFWSRITEEGRFVHPKIDTAWGMRSGEGADGMRIFYRYDDARLSVDAWAHIAIVFEYKEGTNQVRQHFYINGKKQRVGAYANVNKEIMEGKCSGDWTNLECIKDVAVLYGEDTYDPEYASDPYPITNSDYIAFGGSASDITAVQGCVDDFQIWDKAMTEEEVKMSMEGLDGDNLPEGVLAYWDLESDPASDNSFAAKGKEEGAKAYWYTMLPTGPEGASMPTPQDPSFLSGCPYISGTAYPIVTEPTWESRRATISGSGSDTQGSANVTFNASGDHTVTLHLANGHGEATKTYPVFSATSGINGIGADSEGELKAYIVDDALFVEFAESGNYKVDVYNASGMLMASKTQSLEGGQHMRIGLGVAGVYIVNVYRDGAKVRAIKVLKN